MASSFADLGLHTQVLKALQEQHLEQPTAVQLQVIPAALANKNLQISAETGSGKTLAYLVPLLHRLAEPAPPSCGSRALILLPTRELAQQTFKECERLSRTTNTRSVLVIGGQEMRYQASLLRKDPDIIVATPGRLLEHLGRKNADLRDIQALVLDEADRMLDMGFREDVLEIVNRCPAQRQTLLLSATLNHRGVTAIAREIMGEAEIVNLAGAQTPHENITQKMILADGPAHKRKQLAWLLRNYAYDKAVVFANKRTQVSDLADFLRRSDIRSNELHGEIVQDERKHIMAQFKQGNFNVLVATDLAARGLDIKGVDLVINFDMAHSGDEYVHRIGRTGRAGDTGTAISLIADYEWNLAAGIQRYLHQTFERELVPGLEGKFKGPKKLKSSGKAAGKKSKKRDDKGKAKPKQRQRDLKAKGKRRAAAPAMSEAQRSGLAPPKRQS